MSDVSSPMTQKRLLMMICPCDSCRAFAAGLSFTETSLSHTCGNSGCFILMASVMGRRRHYGHIRCRDDFHTISPEKARPDLPGKQFEKMGIKAKSGDLIFLRILFFSFKF